MTYETAFNLKKCGFPQKEDYLLTGEEEDYKRATFRDIGFHVVFDSSIIPAEGLDIWKNKPVEEWAQKGKGRATVFFKKEYLESEEGKFLTVYMPTLQELIEACGDECNLIIKTPDGRWEAGKEFVMSYPSEKKPSGGGETLKEAVANLYIALHTK